MEKDIVIQPVLARMLLKMMDLVQKYREAAEVLKDETMTALSYCIRMTKPRKSHELVYQWHELPLLQPQGMIALINCHNHSAMEPITERGGTILIVLLQEK